MKCNNGHSPPPGHRELEGEELERHLKKMEEDGLISRHVRPADPMKDLKEPGEMCFHIYVKV
jgi:hypothetical protein